MKTKNRNLVIMGSHPDTRSWVDFDRTDCDIWLFNEAMTRNDQDYRIEYKGVYTYAMAHHCQWIGYAGKVAPFCRYDEDAMGDEKPFDNAVDRAGLLRLCTEQRYTRHIGNRLDKDMK